LESLALRVADLVKSSRRAITLESMPASERRIIHITLKDVPEVTTGSIGFGDSRKVVVSPK
jgi:spoIIIJ-associated protein